MLKTREEKIAKDIDDAENSRQNAQVLENKRQVELNQAKDEAAKLLITLRKLVKLKSLRL